MNFFKTILSLLIVYSMFVGCKNATDNKATAAKGKTESKVVKAETASFTITGMTCAIGCAKTIEMKLSKMDGVQKATVDFDKKLATVQFNANVLTAETLVKAVESTGDGETYKVSNLVTKG